jgi:hypothetical protein
VNLLAVGTKNNYGPYYSKWNIGDGSMISFKNAKFRDLSKNTQSNISKNGRYIVTTAQRFFGGWGLMVVDLQTGKDIFNITIGSGQGQISDDAKTLYITQKSYDSGSSFPVVKLATFDIASNAVLSSVKVDTNDYSQDRIGWDGDYLIFYGGAAGRYNTKTNAKAPIPGRPGGSLADWSQDFSTAIYSDYDDEQVFITRNGNARALEIRLPGYLNYLKLSSDQKKILTISNSKVAFYDTITGERTDMPSCGEGF